MSLFTYQLCHTPMPQNAFFRFLIHKMCSFSAKIIVFLCFYGNLYAQNPPPADNPANNSNGIVRSQSNQALPFSQFISGIKYALIELETSNEQMVADTQRSPFLDYFVAYLTALGIKNAVYTTAEKNAILQTAPSLCDIVRIQVRAKAYETHLNGHYVKYISCTGDEYIFTTAETLYKDGFLGDKLLTLWYKMYGKTIQYDPANRLQLPKNSNKVFNTQNLLPYLQISTDEIEGVYEKMLIGANDKTKYEMAVVRSSTPGNYDLIYLSGATNNYDWQPYENIGTAQSTGSQKLYKVSWINPDKTIDHNVYLSVGDDGYLYISFLKNENESYKYFKTFPRVNKPPQQAYFSTGTGIAISQDGYIVTNNHVVEGGRLFEVQCKVDGVVKNYNADLIKTDPESDLALLKINAPDFSKMSNLPYTFKTGVSKMGEAVFTLGYPLTNTMGQDVKLTDGIISALTGYEGDPNTYQVSVPVQPGNSGGPLFDKKGNLIGIIKAKHAQAANATYAIKSRNVINLLEATGTDLILPSGTDISTQDLPEQVAILQNFVFYIKVLQ